MMKKYILFGIITVSATFAQAQAPFTTLVKEARFVRQSQNLDGTFRYEKVNSLNEGETVPELIKFNDTEAIGEERQTIKNDIDFFKNNALSLSLIENSDNRVSVKSQVIHYKLYIANPNEINSYRLNRFNIPLLIISKLSTSYDSLNSASALDVLDYEAAPLTIRIMPSFQKSFITYNDAFYYGFYADLRSLNIYNSLTNDYNLELMGAGGVGLTYQGDGQAGTYNINGEYAPGRYSLSVIYQFSGGNKEVIRNLFETEKNFVSSIQTYFIFKIKDDSLLNFKVGYQYLFDKTRAGTRSVFSLALGG